MTTIEIIINIMIGNQSLNKLDILDLYFYFNVI